MKCEGCKAFGFIDYQQEVVVKKKEFSVRYLRVFFQYPYPIVTLLIIVIRIDINNSDTSCRAGSAIIVAGPRKNRTGSVFHTPRQFPFKLTRSISCFHTNRPSEEVK